MAGTGYQSTDLVATFNLLANRPVGETGSAGPVTDTQKYQYLAQAQDQCILQIANISGNVLYGNPTLMTSADGGYTYTFGVDGNGYPLFLLDGHIYPTLNSIPSCPWVPGQDYLDEGVTIRSLNNTPFSVAPYFQGITTPAAMSASIQPVLTPPYARLLIPIRAVQNFAQAGKRDIDLYTTMLARWNAEWAVISVAVRKHLRGRRLLQPLTSGGPSNGGYIGSQVW